MSDILLVDDQPLKLPGEITEIPGLRVIGADEMRKLKRKEIAAITLFLVDYDLSEILSDDELDEGNFDVVQPLDGLAVIESLRSSFGLNRMESRPLKSFAILTHAADNLSELPVPYRAHVTAGAYNVDWIFQKPETETLAAIAVSRQIRYLADEVKSFPAWDDQAVDDVTRKILGISDAHPRLWEDVVRARPPRHELATSGGGQAFFRWLLQRALPYPGFLVEPAYVAARLGTSVDELEAADTAGNAVSGLLDGCRYKGLLCDFFERARYWRGLLESRLWTLAEGRTFDRVHVAGRLGVKQVAAAETQLVVPLDHDLLPKRIPVAVDDCVRLALDDWPLFADPPWATKSDIEESPFLKSVAVHSAPY